MKKLLFGIVLLLPVLVFSQKDFEGIITYKGFKTGPKNNFNIELYLSKGKMKAKISNKEIVEPGDQETHIYNYNTGIHYIIDDKAKKFAVDSMTKGSFEDFPTTIRDTPLIENILGYQCRGYSVIPSNESSIDGWTSIIWFSDSLKFIVPAKYRGKRSIETLPDGNMLLLKSIVMIDRDPDEDQILNTSDSFFVVADKIERKQLNESEFFPPAGYTLTTMAEMSEIDGIYEDVIKDDSSDIKELTLTEFKKEEPRKAPAKTTKSSKFPAKKIH
jgi:hypothetical protein